jgi:hypothetical protein
MDYIIYQAKVNPDLKSEIEVDFIGLVDRPAIEKNFQAFKDMPAKFIVDDDLRIISGPAMICDMPLYRNDKQLGEYYVVFDKQAIQATVEKFSAKGYFQNFNLFHDKQQQASDVTIFNSFITNSTLGIHPPEAFKDVAEGSWFISAKVNNEDVWQRVKSGEIKGFSVEGVFTYLPVAKVKMTADQLFEKINCLLNETEIVD